ncbi:MAG: 16S rRNA (guanine(966)-N(2))-methyltransferase RsmD [Terriglobia bacterium]
MVRVIAGQYRNRRLKTLEGTSTRPTSDRLKETLFNVLQSRIPGARFLDAYAGCGSIGIEALSRGAAWVAFVEQSPQAEKIVLENLKQLSGLSESEYCVLRMPIEQALKRLSQFDQKFDIVFLDPPYAAKDEYPRVFLQLQANHLLSNSALVIAEHSRRYGLEDSFGGLVRYRQIQEGDSILSFYQP